MRWPVCTYVSPTGATPQQLAAALQRIHDQLFQVLDGKIDGFNLSEDAFDSGVFAFRKRTDKPKRITIPALEESDDKPHIRVKGAGTGTPSYGLELLINPSSSLYGKVCLGDVRDPAKTQRLSMSIDSYTATNPGATITTPTGAMTVNTGGAFDLIFKRSSAEHLRLDTTGLLASKQLRWTTGLGAITHVLGPTDQTLALKGGTATTGRDATLIGGLGTTLGGNAGLVGGAAATTGGNAYMKPGRSDGAANGNVELQDIDGNALIAIDGATNDLDIKTSSGASRIKVQEADGQVIYAGTHDVNGAALKLRRGLLAELPAIALSEIQVDPDTGNVYIGMGV